MSGGWLAAAAILRRPLPAGGTGVGQRVNSSLLGAGMTLHGGVFERDGNLVRGPALDGDQPGFGPGYRLYRCDEDTWLALVIPDAGAWSRLRSLPELADLPDAYRAVRGGERQHHRAPGRVGPRTSAGHGRRKEWVERLRDEGALAEVVDDVSRDAFRRGILDDPVNREMGRAVTYETAEWGTSSRSVRCSAAVPKSTAAPR